MSISTTSSPPRNQSSALLKVFLLSFFLVRLPLALLQRTPFQPDESYQSLEPAHHLVFGYGHLTWEWRFNDRVPGVSWGWLAEGRLRSGGWVAFWASLYWILKLTRLDASLLLVMALIAAGCDASTYRLAHQLYGLRTAPTALLLSLSSLFFGHALTRPFANSIETTLTAAVLCWWPFPDEKLSDTKIKTSPSVTQPEEGRFSDRNRVRISLAMAAFATTLRPTSLVLWVFMGGELLLRRLRTGQTKLAIALIIDAVTIGLLALVSSTVLDTLLYPPPNHATQPFSHPLLTFLAYNILLPTSLFYGSSPWHYYVTQATPILLFASLPWSLPALMDAARGRLGRNGFLLAGLLIWTTGVYSLVGHKEWRFLMPLLPVWHILAAARLTRAFDPTNASPQQYTPSTRLYNIPFNSKQPIILPKPKRLAVLVLLPLPLIFYLSFFHGSAQHTVITSFLQQDRTVTSFGVLMPCHSTPWQSHLHRQDLEDESWFLTCEPPKTLVASEHHQTQESLFYNSPTGYLNTLPSLRSPATPPSAPAETWPSHFVLFSSLLDASNDPDAKLSILLWDRGYREVWRRWNGFDWAQDDERRKGDVVVLSRVGVEATGDEDV